jgi:DNA polymerase I-like protein with 3'-5' exonuclease and polymerase domains
MIAYRVIDVETTIRSDVHGSSPFSGDNIMVQLGMLEEGGLPYTPRMPGFIHARGALHNAEVLVGHNIGFDLKWLWKVHGSVIIPKAIWDTQQVEYLLSGQRHLYPSLDSLCVMYGLPTKDDKIKAYWDKGVDTQDIPPEELTEYLIGDLKNTEALYQMQRSILSHPDLEKLSELVRVKMEDLILTTLMEYYGMEFDLPRAYELLKSRESWLARKQSSFTSDSALHLGSYPVADDGTVPSRWEPNIGSNKDLGVLFFGGETSYAEEVCVGEYKTGPKKGTPKYRKVSRPVTIPRPKGVGAHLVEGKTGPKVDDEVLSAISMDVGVPIRVAQLASVVLDWRALKKEISTYLEGYSKMMTPDDRIHASINHCSTATGRQSCTKPNLQNVSGVEE